jgi:hypothetical protein
MAEYGWGEIPENESRIPHRAVNKEIAADIKRDREKLTTAINSILSNPRI